MGSCNKLRATGSRESSSVAVGKLTVALVCSSRQLQHVRSPARLCCRVRFSAQRPWARWGRRRLLPEAGLPPHVPGVLLADENVASFGRPWIVRNNAAAHRFGSEVWPLPGCPAFIVQKEGQSLIAL